MEIERSLFAATIGGENIYCLGGFNDEGKVDSVESFNMTDGKWKKRKIYCKRGQVYLQLLYTKVELVLLKMQKKRESTRYDQEVCLV